MAKQPKSSAALGETPSAATRRTMVPVVGIGASAGGLEAAQRLFAHIAPDTGKAYVLVQHLDPEHESQLAPLLAQVTLLPVAQAGEGMAVAPNHIYVIPPNVELAIVQGVLHLKPRAKGPGPHLPIDSFFRSLAVDQGARATGIILSGTGSDGTEGLRAIKASGGVTFAQERTSAKYDGMPQSAIAASVVDYILPPEEIALTITHVHRGSINAREPREEAPLRQIFTLLYDAHGVDFSGYKQATIKRRIERRLAMHKIATLDEYIEYLQITADESDALYQDLLIEVTEFFRDPEAFEALKQMVFPQFIQDHRADHPVRVWVPGCASGEEVYSLAICLRECFDESPLTPSLQVFGTDINTRALTVARAGHYPESIAGSVSPQRLQRFFVRTKQGYQVSKSLRESCMFARQDVTSEPPFSRLDLISCRNLLIYLSSDLQKRLISIFHFALNPIGFLLLGISETIGNAGDLFALEDRKYKIYRRKSTPIRTSVTFGSHSMALSNAAMVLPNRTLIASSLNLQHEIDRVLLAHYAPPAVVVDDTLRIIQFRGNIGIYLNPLPGEASLDLLRMAHSDLLIDLRTAINNARLSQTTVRKEGILYQAQNRVHWLDIEVIPIIQMPSRESYFIITFEDVTGQHQPRPVLDPPGRVQVRQRPVHTRISDLQQELIATKEYLYSIIEEQETTNEELRAAYEEIQSSNEELQSTNEELETTKEELQSTNEEMTTINEEMQNRNQALSRTNDDLNNLLSSVNIPIVMVTNDLCIRRFTPMAEKVFNLLLTDVGRPISDLRPKITMPDLDAQIAEVIETLIPREADVQDQEGNWYTLRIRPYRTAENRIDGAVVILMDITNQKRAVLEAQAARAYAEGIVEALREPLVVLNRDLDVQSANNAFYRIFRLTPEEAEHCFRPDREGGEGANADLERMLHATLMQNIPFQDFVVAHQFPRIGTRTLRINARKIVWEDLQELILMAIEDISDQPIP